MWHETRCGSVCIGTGHETRCGSVCIGTGRETRCGSVCIGTGRETLQNKLYQNEVRDIAVVCAGRRSALNLAFV